MNQTCEDRTVLQAFVELFDMLNLLLNPILERLTATRYCRMRLRKAVLSQDRWPLIVRDRTVLFGHSTTPTNAGAVAC
jgi:hypothetical protein